MNINSFLTDVHMKEFLMIAASVMNINLGDMLDVFMNSRRMKL